MSADHRDAVLEKARALQERGRHGDTVELLRGMIHESPEAAVLWATSLRKMDAPLDEIDEPLRKALDAPSRKVSAHLRASAAVLLAYRLFVRGETREIGRLLTFSARCAQEIEDLGVRANVLRDQYHLAEMLQNRELSLSTWRELEPLFAHVTNVFDRIDHWNCRLEKVAREGDYGRAREFVAEMRRMLPGLPPRSPWTRAVDYATAAFGITTEDWRGSREAWGRLSQEPPATEEEKVDLLTVQAVLETLEGRQDAALGLAETARRHMDDIPNPRSRVVLWLRLFQIYAAAERIEEMAACLNAATLIEHSGSFVGHEDDLPLYWGHLALLRGNLEQACALVRKALGEMLLPRSAAEAWLLSGAIRWKNGEREASLRELAKGASFFLDRGLSRWLSTKLRSLRFEDWPDLTMELLSQRAAPSEESLAPAAAAAPTTDLIGASAAMGRLRKDLDRLARSDIPVLFLGQTGSGKEAAAKALHDLSPRAGHPFEAVLCTALPSTLLIAELFGTEKGAFTGAMAPRPGILDACGQGTLLIDEVGDLPQEVQVALLRLLDTGQYMSVGGRQPKRLQARIVYATHRDPAELLARGSLRQDFWFRIKGAVIRMPSLRERAEDIPELIRHFTRQYCGRLGLLEVPWSAGAAARMAGYAWPGNIRELRVAVERTITLRDHAGPVGEEDVRLEEAESAVVPPVPAAKDGERPRRVFSPEEVIAWFDRNGGRGTRGDLLRHVGVPARTLDRMLSALCGEGRLIRRTSGPARWQVYYERPDQTLGIDPRPLRPS